MWAVVTHFLNTEHGFSALDRLLNIDRRYIFIAIFVGVLLPLLIGFHLPVKPTQNVRSIYETIEQLDGDETVFISFDFGPSTITELDPMARAVLRHCFRRSIRVIGVTLIAEGVGIAQNLLDETAAEFGSQYGRDYVFLGYKAGLQVLILNMGQDLHGTFPTDVKGNAIESMRVTRNIKSLRDVDYVIDIASGYPGVDEWIQYGQERYRFPFAAGCTAVMAPDFFPFLQANQMNGLMAGLAGGAEYEMLIGRPGKAVAGMRPQSIGHLVIILFIVFGNVAYFVTRQGRS